MMVQVNSAFLTTAALLSTAFALSTIPSSSFVASDKSVTFALNIPSDDHNNDLYFTLSGRESSSWIAVGMGSDKMKNSLIWMAYADSTRKNITLSPRLVSGHVEPSQISNLSVSVLAGSGITNKTMIVNAMCSNCRSWKGGSINPNNTAENFIFAVGPDGNLNTDSLNANTKRHTEYGSFTMDLTKAIGDPGVPVVMTADTSGVTQTSSDSDHDFAPTLHACLMILAFVGLMPVGVMVLRILHSPKWHGFNQALSAIVALIGTGLGIYCGTMYNRSKSFNSAHQIFGIITIAAMIVQFILGFLHHRIYKATVTPTKLAPIHVWLGRLVILCGVADGFLGFPLALDAKYNWALVAIILAIIIVSAPFAFSRWKLNNQKKRLGLAMGGNTGTEYQAQSLTAGSSQNDINLEHMNYPRPCQKPA